MIKKLVLPLITVLIGLALGVLFMTQLDARDYRNDAIVQAWAAAIKAHLDDPRRTSANFDTLEYVQHSIVGREYIYISGGIDDKATLLFYQTGDGWACATNVRLKSMHGFDCR